ncbi:MAG: M3 family oligoendopeptidase [Anaerolineae bacterium]|nr:M3 family oligoendopeptidase [Anaerolineae bacterium]
MASESSLGSAPHWDLSNVYPGLDSVELKQAIDQLQAKLDDLENYLSAQQITRSATVNASPAELAQVIAGYLDRMNATLRLSGTLHSYIHSFVSTDSYNTVARRLASELEALAVRLERADVLFRGWIGVAAVDGDKFEQALAQDRAQPLAGGPAGHAFYLKEVAEQSRYLMSEAEETLASELALSGANAWEKLRGVVTSQLKISFELDGQVKELPITVVQNFRTEADGELRRRAYEAELAGWASVREPLAACLNGVKGTVIALYKRRGRTDALHQALDQARIDRETLETMLAAMKGSFPAFRRYWQAKARRLGKEALPWWDLSAPAGRLERRYSFAEARDLILEQLYAFSERSGDFTRRAFDRSWIDAEPRAGKRGGAFCMRLPGVEESRILCNFDGSLDQLLTLAHELGHAYHNECQVGKLPLQRRTPMTLAETASILNETIVTDAILAQAANPEEELGILETYLIGASQVIVDIYSRYLFEREVFERRDKAELSADDFCDIMLRSQQQTYGDGLDPNYLNPYMWAWKPHYYSAGLSFYNFPYAFGLLFGLGLYAVYQERGKAFLPEYDALLRSTGEGTAADLAARFGLDIRQRAFWEGSLKVIEKRIDRYLVL